jgi:putative NADH-flavin reductase
MKVCIVGACGKLGQTMVQHALHRGYQVVDVCGWHIIRMPSDACAGAGDAAFSNMLQPVLKHLESLQMLPPP